jgi:Lon protease-like protein
MNSENPPEDHPLEKHLPRKIPVFPLPNVVFFPNAPLPLYIFEARYRKMVSDCLKGDRYLGMMLMKPGWEDGTFEYYEVGGLGRITKAIKHPGGNMDIVLQGLCRYRVKEYVQRVPYLVAEVDILEDEGWEDNTEIQEATQEMLCLFKQSLYKQDEEVRENLFSQLNLLHSTLDITNFMGSILGIKPGLKQQVLEASEPAERVRLLTAILRGELASLN